MSVATPRILRLSSRMSEQDAAAMLACGVGAMQYTGLRERERKAQSYRHEVR